MSLNRTRSALAAAALTGAALLAAPGAAQAAQPTQPTRTEGTATARTWPGVWPYNGHTATVRASRSTGAAKTGTVTSAGRKCSEDLCQAYSGGSYTCWSGGPSGNSWIGVLDSKNRLGWVAAKCVGVSRWS
ncbi:hypothetical protein [Streptomyces laculatispora]|uniref:hypothetical protein n=1 Tax=Streptomyces laculatispora TaxID=887464 RepID=UPI001A9472E6|nr:hypothetical protein [Streptomyces laculatispora]MBO0917282.1 hypothetical protein [Streptomyces laculatispora]